jgi:hypothetical protein
MRSNRILCLTRLPVSAHGKQEQCDFISLFLCAVLSSIGRLDEAHIQLEAGSE